MKVSAPLFFLAVLVSTVSSQSLSYKYKKISDIYSLPNNSHNYRLLLDSVSQVSLMYCMAECSQQADCALVMIVNTTCNFYSSQVVLKKTAGANDLWCQMNRTINVFDNTDSSLISYWPILEQSTIELISGQELSSPSPTYGVDQFGSSKGSIMTTNSTTYWQAPSGIYFSGDFTAMGWIKIHSCVINARFFDFGNGEQADNVFMSIGYYPSRPNCYPYGQVLNQNVSSPYNNLSTQLTIDQWTHLAMTLSGTTLTTYLNAGNQQSVVALLIRSVVRSLNFFGKSNWASDPYSNAEYDEIKFYNRSLGQTEIANDMNNVKRLLYPVTF